MKNKLLDNIMVKIKDYNNYDETKLKEIRYGLDSFILTTEKLVVILLLSYFIHTIKILCIFFITYGVLRLTGFGLHTKKSIHCWIASIITFTLIPFLIKNMNVNNLFVIITSFILLIPIIMYAPSDTEKRPLINKKKRIVYKILTTIVTIVYIVIIAITKSFFIKKLLFFSILLEVLLILPISYKLFGLKYKNYERYKRKEVNNESIS